MKVLLIAALFLSPVLADTVNVFDGSELGPLEKNDDYINTDILANDIVKAENLGNTGTILYFSGLLIQGVGLPLVIAGQRGGKDETEIVGMIFLSTGALFNLFGPIPSCVGASRLERSMQSEFEGFPGEKSSRNYAFSWIFEGGAIALSIVGGVIASNNNPYYESDRENTSFVLFYVFSGILGVVAEVQRATAAIYPLIYSNKAQMHLKEKRAALKILPVIQSDGSAGLFLNVSF